MRIGKKILLGLLALIGVVVVGFCLWQWQNIQALTEASRYSKEELVDQIEEQKEEVEKTLESYGLEEVITDFTFEEEEAIRQGEITIEEAVEQLEERKVVKQEEKEREKENRIREESNQEHSEQVPEQSQEIKNKEIKDKEGKVMIEEAIAQMYYIKATYLGQLGALERQAKAEYKALSQQERKAAIKTLATKYINLGLAAESQCDGEVDKVLEALKVSLQKINEPIEIVGIMKKNYEQEKKLKKAYYLNLMQS